MKTFVCSTMHHGMITGNISNKENESLPCSLLVEPCDFKELASVAKGNKLDSRICDSSIASFLYEEKKIYLRTNRALPWLDKDDVCYILQLVSSDGHVKRANRDGRPLSTEEIKEENLSLALTKMTMVETKPAEVAVHRKFITSVYYHSMVTGNLLDKDNKCLPCTLNYSKTSADELKMAVDSGATSCIGDDATSETLSRVLRKYINTNPHLPRLIKGDTCYITQLLCENGSVYRPKTANTPDLSDLSKQGVVLGMTKIEVH